MAGGPLSPAPGGPTPPSLLLQGSVAVEKAGRRGRGGGATVEKTGRHERSGGAAVEKTGRCGRGRCWHSG
uniref:Uncharacterized protein n=1 Tax=Oryza punctata TaxID=4537 RepID=A0A0E0L241_ORYPU